MKKLLSRLSQARSVMRDRDRPKAGREDVEREAADELSRATGRSGGPSSSEVPTEAVAGNGRAYDQDLASEPDPEWTAPDDLEAEPAEEPESPRPTAAPRKARSRAATTTTRKAPARGRATGATGGARKPATGKAATGSKSRKGAATPAKPRRPAAKSSTRKRQG